MKAFIQGIEPRAQPMTQETAEGVETATPRTLTPWPWGLPVAAALWLWTYAHLTDFADLAVAAGILLVGYVFNLVL